VFNSRWELSGTLEKYFGPAAAGGGPREGLEYWPPARMRAYQRDAIADQLAHVAAHSPFYQRKFASAGVAAGDFQQLEDLDRFPFTHKDELRGDPWILLAVPKDEVCLAHTSTGTTGGDWSYILYTWDDMHARDQAPATRALMPVRRGDVVINALPYEMSSSGQSFQRSLQGGAGALVLPVGKGGFYSDPYKTVKIMADLKADVLITTPPYAMVLAEAAAQAGHQPGEGIRLRFMWLTGEGCSPAYRRRLEKLWNCQGLIFYGSMECGSIGIECPEQSGSHVCQGHVYLEIVDPKTGEPLPAGETGEVVCTVLQRRASPLIRFRTQDLAMIEPRPCNCGMTLPKLHIRGRIVDQIAEQGGQIGAGPVSPYMIEDVLYAHDAVGGNYQIYTAADGLLIEAELTPGTDGQSAKDAIISTLALRGVAADLNLVDHIPRTGGKTRRIRPIVERDALMRQESMIQK